MNKPGRFVTVVYFLVLIGATSANAAGDAEEWLDRMGKAVQQLNYRGTLVHSYHGQADVSQIVHRVVHGTVTERVTAMDGGGREIIRSNGEVTCIFPDQKLIMIEHQDNQDLDADSAAGKLPKFMAFDESTYVVLMHGADRVSGRDAEVLSVRPTDGYRYGYRLWVDRTNAMLLKSQLMDERGRVVEEFLFTDISFPDAIPVEAVQPSIDIDSFVWERPEPVVNHQRQLVDAAWHATDLPAGFVLAAVRSKQATRESAATEQLVYSDGLASVSVFVEVGVAASEQAEGSLQIGASNAYTMTTQGYLITAVGDVPERTAKMIALSVRASGGNQ